MFTRRKVAALLAIGAPVSAVAGALPAPPFSMSAALGALRIAKGPLAGAFTVAPLGKINWYFANLGLAPFAERIPAAVEAYLTLALARLNPANATLADVVPDYGKDPAAPGAGTLVRQDSDDAYAGTLIALAARLDAAHNSSLWWDAHVGLLKRAARNNILALQKPSGLTRTFRNRSWPGADVAYLMDNCEVHSGLVLFAAALRRHGDPDAARFEAAARAVARGIAGLFDRRAGAFRASDADTAPGARFYPDATAQVFPELHAVTGPGLGAAEYDAGWARLGRLAPDWPHLAYDPYPWLLLGTVAAGRDAVGRRLARTQLAAARALYARDPAKVTINELGYFQRTATLLRT